MVKSHLPMQEMKEMWVQSLCEDPLENGVETHSSDLAWRTPGTEEPGAPKVPFSPHPNQHLLSLSLFFFL